MSFLQNGINRKKDGFKYSDWCGDNGPGQVRGVDSFLIKRKGFLKIQNEIIFYNKKTINTFENIKRSSFNSSKKLKYEKDINVIQKDTSVWPNILKILEKLPFVIEVKIMSITNSKGRIIVKFMGNKKTFFQAIYEKKLNFKDLNFQQYVLTY